MNHVAIMKKSWRFLEKIANGEKIIESRWYVTRRAPWRKIQKGDTVYFKNSGEKVTLKTSVSKVVSFEKLTPKLVKDILVKYGKDDGIAEKDISKFYKLFKDKKYCILIFLKNPKKVKPFDVNKKGFGMMSAWLVNPHILN